ncbi:MAG: GGDEF domain-containing protein [Leptospira sp.]|nr:GGDEF domain-containing protein [Leptospira sp.]
METIKMKPVRAKKIIFIFRNIIFQPYTASFVQDNIIQIRQSLKIAVVISLLFAFFSTFTTAILTENFAGFSLVICFRLILILLCTYFIFCVSLDYKFINNHTVGIGTGFISVILATFVLLTFLDPARHSFYLHRASAILVGYSVFIWVYPNIIIVINFFFITVFWLMNHYIAHHVTGQTGTIDQDILMIISYLTIGMSANVLINYWRLMDYRATLKYKKALTDLRIANDEIRAISQKDEMTGLFNRRYLLEQFEIFKERARRQKHSVGLIILDLDYLKKINDKYGHRQGDKVIKEFASIIKKRTRNIDVCARIGGDEFCIIASPIDERGLKILADGINAKTEQAKIPLTNNPNEIINFTVSLGCTVFNGEKNYKFDELYHLIDEALYKSKHAGRNRTTFVSPDGSPKT